MVFLHNQPEAMRMIKHRANPLSSRPAGVQLGGGGDILVPRSAALCEMHAEVAYEMQNVGKAAFALLYDLCNNTLSSLTNSINLVPEDLAAAGWIPVKDSPVLYRDSGERWDRVVVDTNEKFRGFLSPSGKIPMDAIARYMMNGQQHTTATQKE